MTAWYGLIDDLRAEGRRDGGGQRRGGRRRQRRRPARQGARLPRGRHRRRRATSATTWSRNSASTPASTTRRRRDALRSRPRSRRRRRTASTACFENVGGAVLDAVLGAHERFRAHRALRPDLAATTATPMPIANPRPILRTRLKVQGFIVFEHLDIWPQALGELAARGRQRAAQYRETRRPGPRACAGGVPRPAARARISASSSSGLSEPDAAALAARMPAASSVGRPRLSARRTHFCTTVKNRSRRIGRVHDALRCRTATLLDQRSTDHSENKEEFSACDVRKQQTQNFTTASAMCRRDLEWSRADAFTSRRC